MSSSGRYNGPSVARSGFQKISSNRSGLPKVLIKYESQFPAHAQDVVLE